jgi:hypothetical protein
VAGAGGPFFVEVVDAAEVGLIAPKATSILFK